MPPQKKSKAKSTKGKGRGKGKAKASKTADEAQEKPVEINGVLVQLVPGDNEGNLKIVVQPMGNIKLTEAPTILKLAAPVAEEQLGIQA